MKRINELKKIREDEPFFSAVRTGDLEKITQMVEHGANVNAINEAGCTALMLAGNIGRLDIMEYLIQNGAKIIAKTLYNSLAVSVPIRYGYIDIIQFYARHGVDLNTVGSSNQTALHLAVHASRDALTPDFTSEIKRNMLELLLKSGAIKSNLNLEDNEGLTPLMIAVARNDMDTFNWLIEVGSDIAFKNKYGLDAFGLAKRLDRQDMLEILQNKLPSKSMQSGSSYELLMSKLLEEMTPIIEDKVKKLVAQEMKRENIQTLTAVAKKQEMLPEKRGAYFIESFTETMQNISHEATSSIEISLTNKNGWAKAPPTGN